jgi:hypothetical protein
VEDAWKFWTGLVLEIFGLITLFFIIGFFILMGVWIWAIIDAAVKPEQWYQLYPNFPATPQPAMDLDVCPNGHSVSWDVNTCPYCGASTA